MIPFVHILAMEIKSLKSRMKSEFCHGIGYGREINRLLSDYELSQYSIYPSNCILYSDYVESTNLLGDRLTDLFELLENELSTYAMNRTIRVPKSTDCSCCSVCIIKSISIQNKDPKAFMKEMDNWPPEVQQFVYDYMFMKFDIKKNSVGNLRNEVAKYLTMNSDIMADEFIDSLN